MRELINNNEIIITTTPSYHFKGDRCYYTFTTKNSEKIKVALTIDGELYEAFAMGGYVRMDVTDIVARLITGEQSIVIDYTIGDSPKKNVIDDIIITDGKTLPHRTHGAVTDVQIPNTLQPPYQIQVFMEGSGTIRNEKYLATTTARGIDTIGSIDAPSYVLKISYDKPQTIGTIGHLERTQYHIIQVREECVPDNGVVLQYKDTDGCTRFAIGKIIDHATEVENLEYTYNNSEIDSLTQRKVIGGNQSIKVAFVGVPTGQYIEDMLLSDGIDVMDASFRMGVPCVITNSQKVVHGSTMDFVVTLKLIEL